MKGLERIRASIRKWLFLKQLTLDQENNKLTSFQKRLLSFDKKYTGLKRDINDISNKNQQFESFITRLKDTPISRLQNSRQQSTHSLFPISDTSKSSRVQLSKSLESVKSRNTAILQSGQRSLNSNSSRQRYASLNTDKERKYNPFQH